MPDPAGSRGIVLDANVCINLLATDALPELLAGLGIACLLPEHVLAEVTRHPITRAGLSDDDHPLRKLEPRLVVIELDDAERDAFLDLVGAPAADALGDGEAAAIALASARRLDIALDDRKARRIIRERFPALRMFWTVDLLQARSVVRTLGAREADACFEKARRFGRMHVPKP